MQVCASCGNVAGDDAASCGRCGQPLPGTARVLETARSDASQGWVWPWQRAGQNEAIAAIAARPEARVTERHMTTTASAPAHVAAATAGRLILVVANGQGESQDFLLDGRNVTIGRAPACTVAIPDDHLASRLHAMLHYTGACYTISDLGSSNGTLVNGVLIRSATPLAEGDRITVGEHLIVYTQTLNAAVQPSDSPLADEERRVPEEAPDDTSWFPPAAAEQPASVTTQDEDFGDSLASETQEAGMNERPEPLPQEREAEPDTAYQREIEPQTAPLPVLPQAMSPTPAASGDAWVMPAPPHWSAGPPTASWSGPLQSSGAAALDTPQEDSTPAAASSTAPRADSNGWNWEAAPWGQDVDERVILPPPPQAAVSPHEVPPTGARNAAWTDVADTLEEAPATGELEAVRAQFVRSSDLLSRWTESAASYKRHMRTELASLAQDIARTLAVAQPSADGHESSDDLVRLAQDAAQDPHHVNTVLALAARSGDVARALAAQGQLLATLTRVRDQLDELARQG